MRTLQLALLILALAALPLRAEYTWNGSEWVWTEPKVAKPSFGNAKQPPPMEKEPEVSEGSGMGGGATFDEDYDDENNNGYEDYDRDDEVGSGSTSDEVDEPISRPPSRNNPQEGKNGKNAKKENKGNKNNRNNQNNMVDPYDDTYEDPYNARPNSRNNVVDNSQIQLSTSPPYFGGEVEKNDEIPVDPPAMVPTTTTTTAAPPKDPSISSRPKDSSRSTSFFAQPGTLAAVIGGAVVGLLCAILCVMFVVYRMRKKDEGSYALDEPKRSPTVNAYAKHPSREFYA